MTPTRSLGGITVRNTATIFTPDSRLCVMVYAPPKYGKTTAAATLDDLTKKYMGKPTLFIPVEAAEGGGTASIEAKGIDYVQPTSFKEWQHLLASLASDTYYGGVVLDSSSELVKRFIQPFAMAFPTKGTPPSTRAAGVPCRDDYQTMGEQARLDFNKLINLTTHPDVNIRKHLVVTALMKERTDDKNNVISIHPDLPGAMAGSSSAMFQTVAVIKIKSMMRQVNGKPERYQQRMLSTDGDGIILCGDRTHRFPLECEPNFAEIWEKYWIPTFAKSSAAV